MATTTINQHIEITPGVADGKPRIAGHRITVQNIVLWHELIGKSVDEIAAEFGLTLADVYAALAYYHDNKVFIDEAIQKDESFVKALRQQIPSKLNQKLHDRKDKTLHG
ncbi:MAG: DUF433 domain-containing protein [Thermodesulfobacteriota bacterium]|nr:DUF433 domain-containing protein [Thermodesulfobacteriota bacterium]